MSNRTVSDALRVFITDNIDGPAGVAMAMIGLMMEMPANRKDKVGLAKVIAWRAAFGVIVVLGAFAPVAIFSTKFINSLIGNVKLAGFFLTVTAIIGLVVMTVLHALLPVSSDAVRSR